MNAVEKLEAAIAKLEELKRASDPGPWAFAPWHRQTVIPQAWVDYDAGKGSKPPNFHAVLSGEDNLNLIVTLHRTIDAQLAILRGELETIQRIVRNTYYPNGAPDTYLNTLTGSLADAILEGVS